jgi:uncharacterized protein (DUF362 family)
LNNKVSVVEAGKDIQQTVERSIELIGGLRLYEDTKVVIKPNLCNAKNPHGMVITDFRILEAVINIVKEKTDRITVVESDNISDTAENRAVNSGLLEKVNDLEVDFKNLTKDDFNVHKVAGQELKIPKMVTEADYFINLPKIKTEGHVLVTLSIKNLFGILQRRKKNSLHRYLNEILPYLAFTIKHDLIVMDGLVAMEGNGPIIGTPRDMGIIVTGRNPVSVDSVGSRLMCFDPKSIPHIARTFEMGLGDLDPMIVGDDWEKFICEFEKPYSLKASLKSISSIRKIYLPI